MYPQTHTIFLPLLLALLYTLLPSTLCHYNTNSLDLEAQAPQSQSSLQNMFNVNHFGAKGDGRDDSKAFLKAWDFACSSSSRNPTIVVPRNKIYHLKPVTFSGPCNSNLITFKIYGTIKASTKRSDYHRNTRHWIVFENVANLKVNGGGVINGNGKIWWDHSCKITKQYPCKAAPTAVTFISCSNLVVSSLWIKNAQQMHLTFQKCFNVRALNLFVSAPDKSPNTDGIHVTETQNILIKNCVIGTGDDCISIVSGSKNIRATGITCGPGHGISIGSLGAGNSEAYVSNVLVTNAKLIGTTNGVRIKTWQGGSGFARNIVFQNILMKNVSNPIIIDQNYCDKVSECPEQESAVQVTDIVYKNIKGTTASEVAVKLNCSDNVPCQHIVMEDVILKSSEKEKIKAACSSVALQTKGKVYPRCS